MVFAVTISSLSALIMAVLAILLFIKFRSTNIQLSSAQAMLRKDRSLDFFSAFGTVEVDILKSNLRYYLHSRKSNERVALILVKLDNLPMTSISDDLSSHNAQLLKECITRIKSCVRSTDYAAISDDMYFAIMLPKITSQTDVEERVQKVVDSFAEGIVVGEKHYDLSAHVGIALSISDSKSVDSLWDTAKSAVSKSKQSAKNFLLLVDGSNTGNELVVPVKDIRFALDNRNIILHFQPIYSLHTNEIVGAEALVRFFHPQIGIIYPNSFISVAEGSGLIIELGYTVLREACQALKRIDDPNFRMSVNVSGRQFNQYDLVERIKEIVTEESIDPAKLNLEITETSSIEDVSHTLAMLRKLRDFGFGISIDDFGIGYSSFSYLTQFPVTTLKIDRSFTNGLTSGNSSYFVLKSIINMAKGLGIDVVAEGVEVMEQLASLYELSCDKIQGYLLSPPLKESDFIAFLDKDLSSFKLD